MKVAPGVPVRVSLRFDEAAPVPVGRLAARGHRALFEYDPAFLATGLELSPFHLPLRVGVIEGPPAPFDGLHGVFDDSLPDGWGRLLLDRRARAVGVDPRTLGPLDRLACLGPRTIGALCYEPDTLGPGEDRAVRIAALAAEVREVQSLDGAAADVLRELLRLGGSPHGARPKALVWMRIRDGHLVTAPRPEHVPVLVKFPTPADGDDAGAVELAYHHMARDAGLDVSDAWLIPGEGTPGWFATRRFDRVDGGRVHAHTLCGLLHADHRAPSLDYAGALRAVHRLCRDQRAVEAFVARMAFNVLAHNRDDHTRQHTLLLGPGGDWRLGPAYDLTFSDGPGGEHSMAVAGQGRPTAAHVVAEAVGAGVEARRAEAIVDRVRGAVSGWERHARAAGVRGSTVRRIASQLRS